MVTVKDVVKYMNNVLGYSSSYTDETVNIAKYDYTGFLPLLGITDYATGADRIINKGQLGTFLSAVFGSLGAPQEIRNQVFSGLSGNGMLATINKFNDMKNYKDRLDGLIGTYNAYNLPFSAVSISGPSENGVKAGISLSPGWYSVRAEGGNGSLGSDGMICMCYTSEYARRWILVGTTDELAAEYQKAFAHSRDVNGECQYSYGAYYSLGEPGREGGSCTIEMSGMSTIKAAGGVGGRVVSVGLVLDKSGYVTTSKTEPIYGPGPSGGRVQTGSKVVTTTEWKTTYCMDSVLANNVVKEFRRATASSSGFGGTSLGRRVNSRVNKVQSHFSGATPYSYPYSIQQPEGGEVRSMAFKWIVQGTGSIAIQGHDSGSLIKPKGRCSYHKKWSRDHNGRSYDIFDRENATIVTTLDPPQGYIVKLGNKWEN